MSTKQHFTIGELAEQNPDFRRVLWTGKHSQFVIMTIPVGGEIGEEVHENTDQVLTFVGGIGEADLAGHTHPIEAGDQCAVPAGAKHNFAIPETSLSRCTPNTALPNMPLTQSTPPRRPQISRRRPARISHQPRDRGTDLRPTT